MITGLTRQDYLQFVEERHHIWEARQQGLPQPWTEDPILRAKKFTNVFRILDHGSQFLARELLNREADGITYADALMRCFLYRYTNRPEPWEYFHEQVGDYPRVEDLDAGTLLAVWRQYRAEGRPVFGTAFKMFSGAENKGVDRLTWAVNLTRDYFGSRSGKNVVQDFASAGSQAERLAVLKTIPRCSDFMGMQVLTDFGYSPFHPADENEFVVPGPGARIGAKVIGMKAEEAIEWAHADLLLWGPRLYGRPPSLMDVQNTFCEFGKYARYLEKGVPDRDYRPAHPGRQPRPFLPLHWGL